MHRFFLPVALAWLLAAAPAARTAEVATIPYAKLDEVWQRIDRLDSKTLVASVQITSKNKDVKPSAITMTIRSAGGAIPIRIGPDGEILEFPRTDALRKENPLIETNQPKGSLQIAGRVGLPVPASNNFPYAQLVEAAAAADKAAKAQAGLLAMAVPKLKAFTFVFPPSAAGKAKVELVSGKVKKVATADATSEVKLLLDPKIAEANPEVKLSEKPLRILLNSD